MSRDFQLPGVDEQGDRLPSPGHRRPPVRMACQTIGITPGDGDAAEGRKETGQKDEGLPLRRPDPARLDACDRVHQTLPGVEILNEKHTNVVNQHAKEVPFDL